MVDINYLSGLLEEVRDQNKALLEGQKLDHEKIQKIPKMSERIEKLEHSMVMVKLVTMSTNDDLKLLKIRTEKLDNIVDQAEDHEKRLIKLETAS